jgi:L-amino acid N-acyltransferase YncA
MNPVIRLATPADAAAILDIYAPYIQHTSLTFETEVPTVEAFAERIQNYLLNWPWLVCDVDGVIAGYAYGARYRERVAYQWCCESSIYMHDDFQKAGIGRILYKTLFDILKIQRFNNVYAVINLPNEKSVAFHEHCGFEYFATYEKVGWKLGRWKNVGWWKLQVNEYGDDPAAPIKFAELDKGFLPGLLQQRSVEIKK